jgi:YVTN family beta-propeller protein
MKLIFLVALMAITILTLAEVDIPPMDYAFAENFSYLVSTPNFEGKPTSAIVDEKTSKVYITDFFGGKLVVLDGKTNETIETIDVVKTPFGVGINSETGRIYVGGEHANTLSILDSTTNQVMKEITLKDPYDIAVDPNNNTVYVTSDRANTVYAIDGATNEIKTSFEVLVPCGITVNHVTGGARKPKRGNSKSSNKYGICDKSRSKHHLCN